MTGGPSSTHQCVGEGGEKHQRRGDRHLRGVGEQFLSPCERATDEVRSSRALEFSAAVSELRRLLAQFDLRLESAAPCRASSSAWLVACDRWPRLRIVTGTVFIAGESRVSGSSIRQTSGLTRGRVTSSHQHVPLRVGEPEPQTQRRRAAAALSGAFDLLPLSLCFFESSAPNFATDSTIRRDRVAELRDHDHGSMSVGTFCTLTHAEA